MEHTRRFISAKPCAIALWLFAQAFALPASAADDALERARLAAITRQLDLIHRLADQAAAVAPQERRRYYFDYARLHADVRRMRAGIEDYLAPQRAQPRDPVPLTGDYTRDTGDGAQAARP